MADYIISLIPIPVENRVSALSHAMAAEKAGLVFARLQSIPEGTVNYTVYVMEIVSEPEAFVVNVDVTMDRRATASQPKAPEAPSDPPRGT